ncbi:MAG: hypothetical protein ACKVHU_14575 [Acidimicrobiales bacterium]|jgi:hypothetical protein
MPESENADRPELSITLTPGIAAAFLIGLLMIAIGLVERTITAAEAANVGYSSTSTIIDGQLPMAMTPTTFDISSLPVPGQNN